MDLSYLLQYNDLAKRQAGKYPKKRYIFPEFHEQIRSKHYTGIVGSRGVGKTILLKQLAAGKKNCFYISCDTLKDDLYDVINELRTKLGTDLFLLDEIHYHTGFEEVLKRTYDFLDVRIVFTSSVALALWESSYDLSRRVILKKLYPFSFREFLDFKYDMKVDSLDFSSIIDNTYDKSVLEKNAYFSEYISSGILPFALEEVDPIGILRNVLATIIQKDIPRLGKIKFTEIEKIEKMVSFIGKSEIDGINYTSLSQNLSITKYKAEQYIDLLEKAFVINRIMPKGTNVLQEPKILMSPPYRLLFRDRQQCTGGLREDFFVEALRMQGKKIYYLKNRRGAKTPDFLVDVGNDQIVCEVGGKGKGTSQFKGIKKEKQLIFADGLESSGKKRSLMTVGLL